MEQYLNENKFQGKKIWVTPEVELISNNNILGGPRTFNELSSVSGIHGGVS